MNSPGIYSCIAKCQHGNNKECTVKAMEVEIVQGSNISGTTNGIIVMVVLVVVVLVVVVVLDVMVVVVVVAIVSYVLYKKYGKKIFNVQENNANNSFLLEKDNENRKLEPDAEEYLKKIASKTTMAHRINIKTKPSLEKIWRTAKSDLKLLDVEKILFEEKSKHPNIKVYKSTNNGKVLMLNGAIWSTEIDTWEIMALTSLPLMSHKEPKDVLVIGGGDGVIVKHLLQHPKVESITVYEVNERIIELSREYFPSLACSLDDPKVKVHIGDGNDFMKKQKKAFDVIFIHSSTVPSWKFKNIYLDEKYYKAIKKALKNGGIASLTITGKELEGNDPDEVMKLKAVVDKFFPAVNYFYIPFREHPGTLTRCLMCGLNDKTDFMYLFMRMQAEKLNNEKQTQNV